MRGFNSPNDLRCKPHHAAKMARRLGSRGHDVLTHTQKADSILHRITNEARIRFGPYYRRRNTQTELYSFLLLLLLDLLFCCCVRVCCVWQCTKLNLLCWKRFEEPIKRQQTIALLLLLLLLLLLCFSQKKRNHCLNRQQQQQRKVIDSGTSEAGSVSAWVQAKKRLDSSKHITAAREGAQEGSHNARTLY